MGSDVDKKPGDKRYDPFRVEGLPMSEGYKRLIPSGLINLVYCPQCNDPMLAKKPGDKRYDPFKVESLPTGEVINM